MSQQNPMQEQVIAKAMKDEAFRQELLSNPKAVLERELGVTLPQGVTIQVHEDTPTTLHLVLPMKPQAGEPQELSDAELEQVAGGVEEGTRRISVSCVCIG
jgi:hypothetical protein